MLLFLLKILISKSYQINVPGLTSMHRKSLSYNSILQKSLSYKSIHQVYGENACHTFFIHFRKTIEKNYNATQNFSENKFRNKKQLFGLWRKHLSYNFHLWENIYYRVFIQFSVRMDWMKLYEKKFPIYENCMMSIFGQPGFCWFIAISHILLESRDVKFD